MRKGIYKICYTFLLLVFGAVFLACVPASRNAAQNSVENKSSEKSSAGGVEATANKSISTENTDSKEEKTEQKPVALDKTEGQKVVERYIAGVAKVSDADEYKEARKIIYGDLDGDGDEDAAAQFTIEGMGGGNNYAFYLAVFRNENGKLKAVTDDAVGGKLNRDVTLTKIENGRMLFDTKEYDADDGACCPSIEGKTSYILENDKLKEVKTDGKK